MRRIFLEIFSIFSDEKNLNPIPPPIVATFYPKDNVLNKLESTLPSLLHTILQIECLVEQIYCVHLIKIYKKEKIIMYKYFSIIKVNVVFKDEGYQKLYALMSLSKNAVDNVDR